MRPTTQQMEGMSITPSCFDRLVRWGWIDLAGRAKRWFDWQRENHNAQFEEPGEQKGGAEKIQEGDYGKMETAIKVLGTVTAFVLLVAGLAVLGAYPLKWAVNYLLTPVVARPQPSAPPQIGFWQAFCLNYVAASLVKGTPATSTK